MGTSELIDEFLCRDSGLLQDSAQSANGQFCVERHDAAPYHVWSDSLQNYVAATLPTLTEARCSRARIVSAPETRVSLGIARLEDGDKRATGDVRWELSHVEFRRFLEVSDGFFDSLTLTDRPNFRAVGDVQVAFFVQNCCEGANWHFRAPETNLRTRSALLLV